MSNVAGDEVHIADPTEALAEAWASVDGKVAAFRACKADPGREQDEGRFGGYMADAEALLERLHARGWRLTSVWSDA